MATRGNISSRRFFKPGRMIAVLVILAALLLVLVSLLRTADRPTMQVAVDMGSMGLHRLNIWLDPDPPTLGTTTIIAQVVDQGGTPIAATSITFRVGREEGEPGLEKSGLLVDAYVTNRAEFGRYRAVLDFPSPGDAWIDVAIQMAGQQGTARVAVHVSQ